MKNNKATKKRGIESIEKEDEDDNEHLNNQDNNSDNNNQSEDDHHSEKDAKKDDDDHNNNDSNDGGNLISLAEVEDKASFVAKIEEPKSFIPTLWRPYRSIGFITNSVPFVISYEGTSSYVTLCIGKAFQTYDCQHLRTSMVSFNQSKKITAMELIKNCVFTTCGYDINCFESGRIVYTLQGHKTPITQLQKFGDFLLSIDQSGNLICWDLTVKTAILSKKFLDIQITALIHPTTYLNKILLGTAQGKLLLFNIKSLELIYTFSGWESEVTCISQSGVVDVVAIGLKNGNIIVHNLKYDKTIMKFKQSGVVTTLSFRTDGPAMLVSGDLTGNIHIWSLHESSLKQIMKESHKGKIAKLQFLNQEPILISTGDDNSVKMWIFDLPNGLPRVLRERSGHVQPPHLVRFYNQEAILSVDGSALRWMNVAIDHVNAELPQRLQDRNKNSILRYRTHRITDVSFNPLQEKIWESILTTHHDSKYAFTWAAYEKNHHTKALRPPRETGGRVTASCISNCGHFVIEGTINGRIHKFNIQSGEHRGGVNHAHLKSITGVQVSAGNIYLVSSSIDGLLRLWEFNSLDLVHTVNVGFPITKIVLHNESNLLGVATDELCVSVYDLETKRLVRKFEGHNAQITDFCFSFDGRWIVTSCSDLSIRTFDLPTGKLINWFQTPKQVTSVSLSNTGEYLATTHVKSLGVYLWSNAQHFEEVDILTEVPQKPIALEMPLIQGNQFKNEGENGTIGNENSKVVKPLDESFLTFSGENKAKWSTIAHLEVIKERNKPIMPDKKPEQAPFFLPMSTGLEPKFILPKNEDGKEPASRILNFKGLRTATKFIELLQEAHTSQDYQSVTELLKNMTPAAIDAEFRLLSELDDERTGLNDIKLVIEYLDQELQTNQNYELVQSYLNLFLKVQGDVLLKRDDMKPHIERLKLTQKESWSRLQKMFQSTLCLINYFQNIHG